MLTGTHECRSTVRTVPGRLQYRHPVTQLSHVLWSEHMPNHDGGSAGLHSDDLFDSGKEVGEQVICSCLAL